MTSGTHVLCVALPHWLWVWPRDFLSWWDFCKYQAHPCRKWLLSCKKLELSCWGSHMEMNWMSPAYSQPPEALGVCVRPSGFRWALAWPWPRPGMLVWAPLRSAQKLFPDLSPNCRTVSRKWLLFPATQFWWFVKQQWVTNKGGKVESGMKRMS